MPCIVCVAVVECYLFLTYTIVQEAANLFFSNCQFYTNKANVSKVNFPKCSFYTNKVSPRRLIYLLLVPFSMTVSRYRRVVLFTFSSNFLKQTRFRLMFHNFGPSGCPCSLIGALWGSPSAARFRVMYHIIGLSGHSDVASDFIVENSRRS